MAAVQTVDTLTIRGQSQGLDKLATDLNKVAAAQDKLAQSSEESAKVTETNARRQISAAGAFERLSASIDPAFRAQQGMARGQAVLDRAMAQGVITTEQYAARLTQLHARYGALGVANNNLVSQSGNLAAQFQDIAVQLQGGASPFTIAMQQGTQIAAVLGDAPGGARGAVKALGAAFLSVLSPVSLLTIGAIAAGGALFQYMTGAGEKVETLDERLKAHADLIRSIKDDYGDAAEGLEKYTSESGAVLEQQLRARMEVLKGDIQRLWFDVFAKISRPIGPAFTDALGNSFGGADLEIDPKFSKFQQAFDHLSASAADGVPGIRAFREEIARIMQEAADNTKIQDLGRELLKNTEAALKVEDALEQAEKAIRLTSGAAGEGVGDLKEFRSALEALNKVGQPTLTEQAKALQEYRRAVGALSDNDNDGRQMARRAYEEALQRAKQRDAEKVAKEAATKAEQEASRRSQGWERAVDRIQDQTRALEQQAATYGQSAGEIARYRAEQELLNAATEAGRDLTPELRDQIAQMAQRAGAAAQEIDDLQKSVDWSDMTGDALKGIITDLRSGKDAGEAFLNVIERIVDKLLDMSIDWLLGKGPNPFAFLNGAGGGSASSGGSIPTMAQGGYGPDVPAFAGMGKIPEVISSAIEPIKAAASSVASIAGNGAGAVEAYVRQAASIRGIDPDIAARVVKAESGFQFDVKGDNGLSYGPMQLYTGGGLGNAALARGINVRDPSTWREQVDYGMDVVKQDGWRQWYGARNSGIGRWDGIGRQSSLNGSAGNDNLAGGMGEDMQQLSGDFDKLSQSMSSATPQITQGLTGLGTMTQQGGQAVVGALQDTASTIGQGADGVGGAIQQLMSALSRSGGGSLSGLLGLFSKGGGDWSDKDSWMLPSDMSAFKWHDGGPVSAAGTRMRTFVNPAVFLGATTYHDGLRPDEVPAILQQGEWVLSRDDVAGIRNAANFNGGSGDGGPRVTVINNGPTEAHAEEREDGSIEVLVDALDARMGERFARGRGPSAKAIAGRSQGHTLGG